MKKQSIAIYALHPITYQTPIFEKLAQKIKEDNLDLDVQVLFGDDLSLRKIYYEHLKREVVFDSNLRLETFPHVFLKNFSKDPRKGFFSRINPGILTNIWLRKHAVVVIHGYETFTAWLALFFAKIFLRKVIFRGEAVLEGEDYKPGTAKKIKKVILPLFFGLCDAVMYSCQGNKRYFQHFGVDDKKLFLLPCAVNNDYFLEQRRKLAGRENEIRAKLGIPDDHFVVLFSARFTARKRPYDLIDAVKQIGGRKITILFVGDGPERAEMESKVKAAGVNAVFTGFVGPEELSAYYMIADVDVVISAKDPSPKSMNEAMLFSLPIIVTEVVGTAHDLVKDGENGFIVKVGDIKAISSSLQHLVDNPEICRSMGQVSREIVDGWTIDAGAEGILAAVKFVTKL